MTPCDTKLTTFSVASLKAVGGAYDKRKNLFMNVPRSGSSHYTFKKSGCMPITIPKHEPIKKVYVEMVREIVESAISNALDEKKAWLEAALEEGVEIHEPDSLEDYSGQFKLRIPRSLHRLLAEHSQREGISMNQYCVYLLSRNDAVFSK